MASKPTTEEMRDRINREIAHWGGKLPERVAIAWLAGIVAFVVVTAAVQGLLLRVELGFLVGSAVAALVMATMLVGRLRAGMEIVAVP